MSAAESALGSCVAASDEAHAQQMQYCVCERRRRRQKKAAEHLFHSYTRSILGVKRCKMLANNFISEHILSPVDAKEDERNFFFFMDSSQLYHSDFKAVGWIK